MAEEKKEETVEEFLVVEEGTPEAEEAKNAPEPRAEDERLRNEDDDEEDDNSSGNDGETPEQRAERRREERRKRRERQKAAEAANKAELQRLREMNEHMATKMQQLEAVALRNESREIDQRMNAAQRAYYQAERAHAEAVAAGNGEVASRALRVMNQASADYHNASAIREKLSSIGQEPAAPQQRQQRGPDPRVAEKARAFIERHSWIDPTGQKDDDSAVARAIDLRLQSSGLDPTTDEYWNELERALEKKLPHRFQKQSRSAPPVAGGSDRAGSGKKTFVISPDRKKAMIDAGIWDDPVQRNKMIKRYAEYDAQQKTTATR